MQNTFISFSLFFSLKYQYQYQYQFQRSALRMRSTNDFNGMNISSRQVWLLLLSHANMTPICLLFVVEIVAAVSVAVVIAVGVNGAAIWELLSFKFDNRSENFKTVAMLSQKSINHCILIDFGLVKLVLMICSWDFHEVEQVNR